MDLDDGAGTLRQNPWEVLRDASAGDVSHSRHRIHLDQAAQDGPITLVDLHQLSADLTLDLADIGFGCVAGKGEEQCSGQRVTVGVESIRWQPDQNVAPLHTLSADDPVAIDHANDKAGKIVFPVR